MFPSGAFSAIAAAILGGGDELKGNLHLEEFIRNVPDFPEKGIQFKDITPLVGNSDALETAVKALSGPFNGAGIDVVVAIEARGYLLGAPVAMELGTGLVPVRKVGRLPWHTYRVDYALEYGSEALEMHRDALKEGARALLVDDVLATGGTMQATAKLVEQCGGSVAGMAVLIELAALRGRDRLTDYDLHSLIVF